MLYRGISHPFIYFIPGSAVVKCSQTGKLHQVKIKDLSREDCEPLTKEDLVKGSELMLEIKGKIYPVQFHHMKDKASTTNNSNNKKARCDENVSETPSRAKAARKEKSNSRKRPAGSDEGLRDKTNVTEILAKAKVSILKKVLDNYYCPTL